MRSCRRYAGWSTAEILNFSEYAFPLSGVKRCKGWNIVCMRKYERSGGLGYWVGHICRLGGCGSVVVDRGLWRNFSLPAGRRWVPLEGAEGRISIPIRRRIIKCGEGQWKGPLRNSSNFHFIFFVSVLLVDLRPCEIYSSFFLFLPSFLPVLAHAASSCSFVAAVRIDRSAD